LRLSKKGNEKERKQRLSKREQSLYALCAVLNQ